MAAQVFQRVVEIVPVMLTLMSLVVALILLLLLVVASTLSARCGDAGSVTTKRNRMSRRTSLPPTECPDCQADYACERHWLEQEIDDAARDVAAWPEWMRRPTRSNG